MLVAVPFTIDNVFAGLGQCEGLLRHDGDHLCLEFQLKDAVAGVLKTDVRQVRVPLDQLAAVTLSKGWLGINWLGVTISIQAAQMDTLKDVPGMSQGRVELSVSGKHVQLAEEFIAKLHGPAI